MKLTTTLLLFFTLITFSQTDIEKANQYLNSKGEVFFHFTIDNKSVLNDLTGNMSIINFDEKLNKVYARVNKKEFNLFLTHNYPFIVNKKENETDDRLMYDRNDPTKLDFFYTAYPTYDEYLAIMDDFQTEFPNLCQKIVIGNSVQNRQLLAVKLSDNVNTNEQEPKFLYVSTMHGDETTGFPIMLRLIEYLLDNYGTNAQVTDLLDNNQIYISPLHNPDGTYAGGNSTVSGATRGNANFVDLNRNFPDPEDGLHPDGNGYEPETLAYMAFAEANHFVLSCNFHGGIEVTNYPWDSIEGSQVDEDYWNYVCHEYADETHNVDSNYMTAFDNGVTNGFDWYEVRGGRQDYMNYYNHAREMTIEISNQKNPPGNELPYFWNTNKNALLNYIKQVEYGIRGVVTDATTGDPIKASVYIGSKDLLNTWVETDLPFGDYYRPIKGGTYEVTFSAPCYQSQTVSISVNDLSSTTRNITLQPLAEEPIVNNVTIDSGNTANLTTSTSGNISWFATTSSTTALGVGNNFTTPILTETTNYYVENSVQPVEMTMPSPNNTSDGSFFDGTQSLIFDCFEAIQLHKVTVNAESSGSFTMELQDDNGTVLQSGTFNVSSGVQEVTIDFDIPVGKDLRILRTSGTELFRNNDNVDYPYNLERFITIKRSTANTDPFGYYYSFYSWKLQSENCVSDRVEVVVTVDGSVSVDEQTLNSILMYPNPVNDVLRFSLNNSLDDLTIEIYDLLGKRIIQRNFKNVQNDLSINVAQLNSGVYFVRLNSNDFTTSKQLVVE